ncbi:uncharacterized protein LOC128725843 [Anopheles nili]|uniref:uncharacterized protein LOC128725843 n=1 Tax=Anopheles nili TaxID=185578 RepID=UPI00237ACBD4|nr:uncharacterized protein LOC128725843 [Anopheles nili]
MHSGSSISPKHPAIPVSIGIASLVLEGRSSALDDNSIHSPGTGCTSTIASTGTGNGNSGSGGGGAGSSNGSGAAAPGDDDEDGGFCGRKRNVPGDGATGGACSLQECSLLAINESHKSLAMAATCCHATPDEAQRINLKLQQIRSSCPGTSKDVLSQLVTVSGEPSRLSGGGGLVLDRYEQATPSTSWLSHELGSSGSGPTGGVVMYSGFEKMNVLGTVSPIKNHHPVGAGFIHFSSPPPAAPVLVTSPSQQQIRKVPAQTAGGPSLKQHHPRTREGPHCEQFLKKIGLTKPDATDGPEHCCSYRNQYCLRWQVYFKQLSSILTNGEAVCIEVYLGPENHTILLEQWILKLVMTKSPTTMTIQSLCAAIRSQLYFSQISAWTDLIKNSLEPELFSHPRIRKVAPVVGSRPFLPQAKLDILFRIRTYDTTACFNEKPIVHNFPDASVADNFVLQVCLKSLPRLDRIPGIDAALDAAKMTASLRQQQHVDRIPLPCHEKGKHRCAFLVELDEEEEDDDSATMVDGHGEGDADGDGADGCVGDDGLLLTSAAISHREKQLLKYRKRMLKREKKKKASSGTVEVNSNGSSAGGSSISSSSGSSSNSMTYRNGSSKDASSSHFVPKSYAGSGMSAGKKFASPGGGTFGCANGGGMSSAGSCSNGACGSTLTSSINSIQPPLYSSNDHQQAMMICDDRFHAIANNSKSTQTVSGPAGSGTPYVASVATQTDAIAPAVTNVCNDCNNRASSWVTNTFSSPPVAQICHSREVSHTGGSGHSSNSSSTNRDRHMQYFNEYYRTYDIINENCDKRQATPPPVDGQWACSGVPMEEGFSSGGQKPPRSSVPEPVAVTDRRACFIVGGDGYEGDEDDDSEGSKGPAQPQDGDRLLQAIQRTATASEERNGQPKNGYGQPVALNNNNYVTTNNNIVANNGIAKEGSPVGGRNLGQPEANGGGLNHGQAAEKCETSECDTFSKEKKLDLGDCRLCKRQKTKHNFKLNLNTLLSGGGDDGTVTAKPDQPLAPPPPSVAARKEAAKKTIISATVLDCGLTPPGCRRTLSESLVGHLTIPGTASSSANGSGSGASGCGSNGSDTGHSGARLDDGYGLLYPIGGDLSPGDSPMLSSSTGAVGNGGVFTFEQMKSYRRAFSEDVIDTITTLGGRSMANGGRSHAPDEDSTEDDGSSGDNEQDTEPPQECVPRKAGCGVCSGHRNGTGTTMGVSANGYRSSSLRQPHTSTPSSGNGSNGTGSSCKEPLYISCSETDCSVSTASSVSPHKKQILSCAAIGGGAGDQCGSMGGISDRRPSGRSEDRTGCSVKKQLTQYKSSPKINLNYVFCLSPLARDDSGFTSGSSPATSSSFPATSPITIDGSGGGVFGGSAKTTRNGTTGTCSTGLFRYDFEELPVSPISGTIKSRSAPAYPFSPPPNGGALSPRFLRNAQRQFPRTRYPSERSSVSERSSIGSDEQLSDDDLSPYLMHSPHGSTGPCYSPISSGFHQDGTPMTMPLKMGRFPARFGNTTGSSCLLPTAQMLSKVLNRNLFKFGRAPLLGTLEESLLQRRLAPKFQVADFKVLLGASGSFCPTQLTIPVASYFYELPGQHLTTPYVCELRLPRKGYSIPRTGTVQATLLNPLGTVVRMFVVPYDFRDMPAMSTTFIRQRVLACDDGSLKLLGKNIEQLSNAEQMKLLRYAIHLRFQTSRSGKLSLHTDIRLLISRRTDCDTAAAHAKNLLESPNELKVVTIVPENPKFSLRTDKQQ